MTPDTVCYTRGGENLCVGQVLRSEAGDLGTKRRASQFIVESDCGSLKQTVMSSDFFLTAW